MYSQKCDVNRASGARFFYGQSHMARGNEPDKNAFIRNLNLVEWWFIRGVTFALLLMFVASMAAIYGFSVSFIPTVSPEKFVWIAGGWALLTGRFKLG